MEKKAEVALIGGAILAVGAIAAGAKILIDSIKTMPKGLEPVNNFDVNKYMGRWYEIARMDYRYEKNLNNTTAEYSLNEDGSVKVVNRGYNYKKNKMEEAVGKAVFVDSPSVAKLKVSFFGPFYAGYNVVAIDPDYKYALVAGKNMDYLWILSREPSMPSEVIEYFLQQAESYGYETSKLVWVDHTTYQFVVEQIEIIV